MLPLINIVFWITLIFVLKFLLFYLPKKLFWSKLKKNVYRTIIVFLVIVGLNITSYNNGIGNYLLGTYNYCYSNNNYKFQDCELLFKQVSFNGIEKGFERYKKEGRLEPNDKLYRNFKKTYLFFWLWYDYAMNPKWDLDYLPPNQNK